MTTHPDSSLYPDSLHPETRAMLETLEAGFPKLETMTGPAARELIRSRRVPNPHPEPVGSVSEHVLDGPGGALRVRLYRPVTATTEPTPAVVFAHGGGFVFCDLDTHDDLCRSLCNGTDATIVSVDYRLAPEHPGPAAADDVHAAFRWVHERAAELGIDPARIALAGDSAGGNLAAVTAVRARDEGGPTPSAQILLYPVIDDDFDTDSYRRYGHGYYNTRAAMQWYWRQYAPGGATSSRLSVSRAESLSGLASALIVTAGLDPLRDEGDAYAERLTREGVPTVHRRYDGLFHGFLTFPALGTTFAPRAEILSLARTLLGRGAGSAPGGV